MKMEQGFKVGDKVKVVGHIYRKKEGIIVEKSEAVDTASKTDGHNIVRGKICFWKVKTTTGEVIEVGEIDLKHL